MNTILHVVVAGINDINQTSTQKQQEENNIMLTLVIDRIRNITLNPPTSPIELIMAICLSNQI